MSINKEVNCYNNRLEVYEDNNKIEILKLLNISKDRIKELLDHTTDEEIFITKFKTKQDILDNIENNNNI